MKKLLAILICVLLSVSTTLAKDFAIKPKATVYNSTGGQVGATKNAGDTPSNYGNPNPSGTLSYGPATETGDWKKKNYSYKYTMYYHAKSSSGYFFKGWSIEEDEQVDYTTLTTSVTATVTQSLTLGIGSLNADALSRWAIFNPIISKDYGDKVTMYYDPVTREVADGEWQVKVFRSKSMTVESLNSSFTLLSSSTVSLTGAEDVVTIKLRAATGTDGVHTGVIRLTPSNSDLTVQQYNPASVLVDVQLLPAPTITFAPAIKDDRGNSVGTYTYQQVSKSPKPDPVTVPVDESKEVGILKGTDGTIELVAKPAEGYRVYRWIITKKGSEPVYDYLSGAKKTETFTENTTVSVEFTEDKYALFFVKEAPTVKFDDLNDAIAASGAYSSKTVVVDPMYNDVTKCNGGYLRAGTYTIPDGYTLLVPADDEYTALKHNTSPAANEWAGKKETLKNKNYCKLIVESGTTINVEGVLCVYAKWNWGSTTINHMKPGDYAWIEMEDNSVINVGDATLHALGYITNVPTTHITEDNIGTVGRVVANDKSIIYEIFVLGDWRGGTAVCGGATGIAALLFNSEASVGMVKNKEKVFPMSQYYIQNIEVPMTLNPGSKEKIHLMLNISDYLPLATADFIVPNDSKDPDQSQLPSGMFRLGDKTKVTKYYDVQTDRLKFIIDKSSKDATQTIPTFFHTLKMDLDAGTLALPVSSEHYNIPINNNMDIIVKSGSGFTVPSGRDVAFLPNATLTVEKGAFANIDANVYVYDEVEKKFNIGDATVDAVEGYFGSGNLALYLIPSRAGGLQPNVRTVADMEDAKWHIDGVVTVNGALYTTVSGANITSSGGGQVIFNKKGTSEQTHQAYQSGETTNYPISITNAKLRNANGTFSAGNDANDGQKYIYYADIDNGTWSLPLAAISDYVKPNLKITLPTTSSIQDELVCTLTKPEEEKDYQFKDSDFTISSDDSHFLIGTWKVENDKLYIPITYNSYDAHGEYSANISIATSASATIELGKSIEITAVEDYKPQFSVAPVASFTSTVDVPAPQVMPIVLVDENVTTIWNHTTYGSRLVWEPEITGTNAEDFRFDFGDGDNKFNDAQVIFHPLTEGQGKSATLTLTATYTDGVNHQELYSIDIPLFGNATRNKNILAFAEFPDPIYVDTEAFLLFATGSDNAKTSITITTSPTGIVDIIGDGTEANPYMVKPLSKGVVKISVTQIASNAVVGIEEGEMDAILHVVSEQASLYPLDLCVDNQDIFSEHTVSTQSVIFDNDAIVFTSKESQSAVWEMQFKGVPNQMVITLVGEKGWLIEQKSSDVDAKYETLLASNAGTYTLPLLPETRYLRFTYAQGDNVGKLQLCVYALDINVDAEKVYLPVNVDANPSSRKITFHHSHALTFNTISELSVQPSTINSGTQEEPYYTTTVIVSPTANTVLDKEYTLRATDTEANTKDVTVRTYRYPQELPISLAEDESEKFYFVKDTNQSTSDYVSWDIIEKQIIFQNPNASIAKARFVTIIFEGAPYSLSFDVVGSELVASDWVIRESADGTTYNPVVNNPIVNGSSYTQDLDYRSKYVRIENKSENMSELRLSNLVIVGKTEMFTVPTELVFDTENDTLDLVLTAVNLDSIRIELDNPTNFSFTQGEATKESNAVTALRLGKKTYNGLGYNKYCEIPLSVIWAADNIVDAGNMIIYDGLVDTVVATVRLLGADNYLVQENAEESGLFTGIPQGYTYNEQEYTDYEHRPVNLINTFAEDGTALFDYLFIYGETKPSEGTNITLPEEDGNIGGSNAVTPYYVYKKSAPNTGGKSMGYEFVTMVENANTSAKVQVEGIISKDSSTVYIDVQDSLRVYMTGFCPYATTGFTKEDEGVWFFHGEHGEKLDIYLEDCYIFSRNKTEHGNAFYGDKEGGDLFNEDFARGSGGVLVFENTDMQEQVQNFDPFEVNIHMIGDNLLKSNYGCFFIFLNSMKAYQISAPIHVRMASDKHVRMTKTTLNFDDKWPTSVSIDNAITATKRTNGKLGLKKQSNNAPSIDLGNPLTEVNFNGGQVELQNAQIVSTNYKTTLAISYRSGEYGGDDLGIKLSYGIGTDSVGGTVNFNDGTTTVEPMWVAEAYKQYYLIDTLPDGKEWKELIDTDKYGQPIYKYRTSCLRTPKNTYVYGGSHCFMRACQHVTSKGGAPKDGTHGKPLGQYTYTLQAGDSVNPQGLAVKIGFPLNLTNPNLQDYYDTKTYDYGLESVSPDEQGQLHFWIPEGYGGVTAEQDKYMSIWKACMTEIRAGLGDKTGGVGGHTPIEPNEEVKYFLYCKIDENIHKVIADTMMVEGVSKYTYQAPLEVPPVAKEYFKNADYTTITPSFVGDTTQYEVLSDTTYTITDKVYYVTNATADIWQTFTAPFDVAKISVVETFSENELKKFGTNAPNQRTAILQEQARHNADYAAFFAVAMATGTYGDFDDINTSYLKWAKKVDEDSLDLSWNKGPLRSKQALVPYVVDANTNKGNWRDANFYLNHNKGNWKLHQVINEDGFEVDSFAVQWEALTPNDTTDGILLHKGETYSLMFPYCPSCEPSLADRDYWDYWSGKYLIFEGPNRPQVINGKDFLRDSLLSVIPSDPTLVADTVKVTGNSTFAFMDVEGPNVYVYNSQEPALNTETFMALYEGDPKQTILPTTAFLYGQLPTRNGMPARSVNLTGKINYDNSNDSGDGTTTGGHIPTVGGGNDLFITSTATGINIAVAQPQQVRVMSATGAIIYSGMVQTAVDVLLPTTGVYVITGENEVHKILH